MSEQERGWSPYDVVIIGAGPAGLTAAMYSARQGLSTAIVAGEVGGQAAWAGTIENYMGWQVVTGPELIDRFRSHVAAFDVECIEGHLVNALVPTGEGFDVHTREGATLAARAVIVATGKAPNRLSVPGESELTGRGVSYCATCDAPLFKDRVVAVVGPGESAALAALQLAHFASRVVVMTRAPLKASEQVLANIASSENVEVWTGVKVTSIEGDDRVTALNLERDGRPERLDVGGVFIETGAIAAADFTGGLLETNERGEIVVDKSGATSQPGIWAAGDVTDDPGKQVIIAAGHGARAAIAAGRALKSRGR